MISIVIKVFSLEEDGYFRGVPQQSWVNVSKKECLEEKQPAS